MEENYTKEEALQMESQVLSLLNFELTAPTPRCFLSGLVDVARGPPQLEFLADFIAELSLLEYHMLQYPPSMIAASSLFLARFVLRPKEHPWTRRLADHSFYQPCELSECVKDLFWAFVFSSGSRLTAIRDKYSKPERMFVAAKYFCSAPAIPERYFSRHPLPLR
ncbi:uncharacterized protein A4U43_C05F14310 [Asparagus officinalis]|uniref:Cyclin C-terminal domain-containing protein n=1 Tax=Asparagus officinalis TaxID=4686 RepID=A0A5P1ERS8_ASPOF|nr:uncharacterized protein A4U43_C05F14260 [Asparagus officinalis]ONK68646.1 uncharacterized protein A4U43_C05F14310 [Asparagus officinalis]